MAASPANTTGTFLALNKTGQIADVVGTGTLAHSQQASGNIRLAYDITPLVQATYSFGIWNNHQTSDPQTYLRSTITGQPTYGGVTGFASNKYIWDETHVSNAISLKSDTKGKFDFDVAVSSYNYLQDTQLSPFTVLPNPGFGYSNVGKITRMDGTNWQNGDAKGIWRPFGFDGSQEISFGVHGDRYRLENPVYQSAALVRGAVVDGHGTALFDRSRRDQHRRALAAGRLEDPAKPEADAGRPAGKLARV